VARVREPLTSPNLTLANQAAGAAILVRREIDRHLVAVLQAIVPRHRFTITARKSDRSLCTTSATMSNHGAGRAADIGAVDRQRCDAGGAGRAPAPALELARLPPPEGPTELILVEARLGQCGDAWRLRPARRSC
jgi:hypothetical protein